MHRANKGSVAGSLIPFGAGTTEIVNPSGLVVGYIFAEAIGDLAGIERAVLYKDYRPPPESVNLYRSAPPEHQYDSLEAWNEAVAPGSGSIWRDDATYVKVNLVSYPEGPPPSAPEPPVFPVPPPGAASSAEQVDYGTSQLSQAGEEEAGYVFGSGDIVGQTNEYWYTKRAYQPPPENEVTIEAVESGPSFVKLDEYLDFVREAWAVGDGFVITSVNYYVGYVPDRAEAVPRAAPEAGALL